MEEKTEIWKSLDFLGYPDYEVSNMGQVKSLSYRKTGKERILKPQKTKFGYLRNQLSNNSKGKWFLVHRLVALTFLENPLNLPCVNHKDEDKENNHIDNLEWCTHEYNNNYGTHNEIISKKQRNNPRTSKIILQYTLEGKFVAEYPSSKEVERVLKFSHTSINKCCQNKKKYISHNGYIWFYKHDFTEEKLKQKIEQVKNNNRKGSKKAVIMFDLCGNFLQEFESASQAGKELNLLTSAIINNCNGVSKTSNGYIFKYK